MAMPIVLVVARAFADAGIPIDGVSIGTPLDRSTWRIDYGASATAPQRVQGEALLASIDPADVTLQGEVKSDVAQSELNREALRAIVQGIYEAIPAPSLTLAQVRNRIVVIYRGLI